MHHAHLGAGDGRRSSEGDGESVEKQSLRDIGHGERGASGFHTAGVSAVSPHEDDRQGDEEQEGGGTEDEEEMFKKVFGESVDEALREMSEEGVGAKATKVEAVPSKKEVEEHNLDHAVLRSWHPHCVKGRADAYGHKKRGGDGGDAPTVSLDYM